MKKAKNRLAFTAGVLTLLFLVILTRITYLSFNAPDSQNIPDNGVIRGPIQDRRGLTLALTEEGSTIAIAPPDLLDPEFTAEQLAPFLHMTTHEILKKIYLYHDRRYFLLKRQVDNFTADRIMELHIPGVHRELERRRVYPGETLASNLLGFVGRDQSRALAGIERVYHDVLTTPETRLARKGPTLRLTLDSLIQYRLEKAMAKAFEHSESKRATGIFMDVETGEILALANFPNFNPNKYYKSNPFQRGNWAIRLNYEPGSTVKIFMAAMLINERAINLQERFNCDGEFRQGSVVIRDKIGNRIIKHGYLRLEEILQYSSNVGIIKAMQRIPGEKLHSYMSRLGFGERTEALPPGSGETGGYLPAMENWVPSTGYYMPIGQGFSVTPIQLLRAGASIANGGKLVHPFLEREIVTSTGEVLDRTAPSSVPNPFPPSVNRQVLRMMRKVVAEGTGIRANLKEIAVAGKTGTGEKSDARGYSDKYTASFLGFFPAERPRYGALILYDEPGPSESGGSIAAPVFAEFAESILPLIHSGFNPESVPKLEPVREFKPRVNRKFLYDFRTLSAREAIGIINDYYGKPVELRGSGYVTRQLPEPGTPMEKVDRILLFLDAE